MKKEYIIMGRSAAGKEELDSAETEDEALRLVQEYRMAFGSGWTIWKKEKTSSVAA